jgi:SAM-dependent methyltransferase
MYQKAATRDSIWPISFERIPNSDWTAAPLDQFGLAYDRVGEHLWYKNIDPMVGQLLSALQPGSTFVDYSAGTAILTKRVLRSIGYDVGAVLVDSSQKFLRVALEEFRDDPRVAVRLLRYLSELGRLETLDEVMGEIGQVDVIAAANAVHLYPDLIKTFASWAGLLKPGGLAVMNSGNLINPSSRTGDWIIDQTVAVVNDIAIQTVFSDPRFAEYRDVLSEGEMMAKHDKFRRRVFVPPRPLSEYVDSLKRAGLRVDLTYEMTIFARVDEWCDLLCTYHEGVLSWVGGSPKVDGRAPTDLAIEHRHYLIRDSMRKMFPLQDVFPCTWTYITCSKE